MRSRRLLALLPVLACLAAAAYLAAPYARATSLIVRAADLGGRLEATAARHAYDVHVEPRHGVPTRHGEVTAQFYTPDAEVDRTILVIPGIHSLGIDEPRLTQLATDLSATGVRVMAMALPDLQQYRITPRATDVIEDAARWLSARTADRRVGILGVSFSGGLSVVAAGRPSVRDRIAFVVSFGGHGDLRRVMRYLATGQGPAVRGVERLPPHDYGVAIILYGLAHRVVPPEQVEPLRENIGTFLLASQLTRVDRTEARATFTAARERQQTLPEPAATYMAYVNDRAVARLGAVLEPHLDELGADDPALSAELAAPPAAPVYLLHGTGDTVIPAAESVLLGERLRQRGTDVRVLLSGLITHAEADEEPSFADVWALVRFWASVLAE